MTAFLCRWPLNRRPFLAADAAPSHRQPLCAKGANVLPDCRMGPPTASATAVTVAMPQKSPNAVVCRPGGLI
jgi:hypothetical protein